MFNAKKKLIAQAIAVAFALPIAAQAQSSVTIYGKLYPQINNYSITGASAPGTPVSTLIAPITGAQAPNLSDTVMESSNSRLGFRGKEDLGGNLKALFQLEMQVGVDSGVGGASGALFSRDTFVGLAGDFGTVKLGKMDTVYKNLGDTLSFLGISSGNFVSLSNILSKHGIGSSSASSFHLRRDNSLVYESPDMGGFQGLFMYSAGEVAGNTTSKSVVSGGVKYENGPVYLALAHEVHNDLFGGSNNINPTLANTVAGAANPGATSKDRATRVTGQYRFNEDTRVEANIARLQYNESGGAVGKFSSYKTTTWSLAAEHRIGAITLAANYGQAGAGDCSRVGGVACNTLGLEGKLLALGSSYALSKRTSLFGIYANLKNAQSSTYSNVGDAPRPKVGADIRQIAVGISHSF